MFRQYLESAHADAVGKHDATGSRIDDGLVYGRQQGLDFLVGELSIDRSQNASGTAILVLQPGSHRHAEGFAIDPIERTLQ